jgi:hypothetical protein
MMRLRYLPATACLSAALLLSPTLVLAQNTNQSPNQKPGENIQTKTSEGKLPTKTDYSTEELLTSTVHQAWLLSGKNETNFFEMVEQLANLSAKNRGITLPESEAAGRRMGEYIKQTAKADTDQLLYAVVDKAVVMTAKTPVHVAGQKR